MRQETEINGRGLPQQSVPLPKKESGKPESPLGLSFCLFALHGRSEEGEARRAKCR